MGPAARDGTSGPSIKDFLLPDMEHLLLRSPVSCCRKIQEQKILKMPSLSKLVVVAAAAAG